METYLPLLGVEQESFERLIQDEEQYKELEQMVTVYEQKGIKEGMKKGIEKGIKKGLKKGIEKGIEKGKQDALIK